MILEKISNHYTLKKPEKMASEASTRARLLARNFEKGCWSSLAAAKNQKDPASARSLA
jgi:hypothetical protein